MNAIKFIKDYGIEKAREVVEGAPERATHLRNGEYVRVSDPRWMLDGYVSIADLKRLVESVDLVNLKGGVKKLKKEADCLFHNDVEGIALRYEQAISDYKALYSIPE